MKTNTKFLLLFVLVPLIWFCANKQQNGKWKNVEYFDVPVLYVNQTNLLPILDTVINEWNKYSKDLDKEQRCFDIIQGTINPGDTSIQLNSKEGAFVIRAGKKKNDYFDGWSILYYNIGCIEYKQHLFFIHKCFMDTKWFSRTYTKIRLKSYAPSSTLDLTEDRCRDWVIHYKNGKFFIPPIGGRWWGNP